MTKWQVTLIVVAASLACPPGPGAVAEERGKNGDQRLSKVQAKAKALGLSLDYEQAPRALKITRPKYPKPAFDACVEGTVVLMIVIDASGRVTDTEVLESIPGLDEAALKCVSDWRFQAARVGGKAVGTVATAPVVFRIYEPEKRQGCKNVARD